MQFEKYAKSDNLNNYDVFPIVMNAGVGLRTQKRRFKRVINPIFTENLCKTM